MQPDDIQLVDAARKGDFTAATALVDRFYEPLFAFLRRLAGNDPDAADLTQKTFTRLWPALARFAGRSSVSSWLHGIAYHVYQDWLRSNHRLESRPDAWWEDCPDPRATPDALTCEADLHTSVFAAVDQLPDDLRTTVHLHYYQGLTLAETAEALDLATSTVKHRLRTAVQSIQSQIREPARPSRIP